MLLGHTNKKVLENLRLVESAVVERLVARARSLDVEDCSAVELVRRGLVDPVRLFVKNEPHTLKKIRQERYRLISGVSLVDQIVERLLCSKQNNAEIRSWSQCPSKPGISLADDGLLLMRDWFVEQLRGGPLQMTDVSGWDWSVQRWEMDADANARARLAGCSDEDLFTRLQKQNALICSRTVFVLPGGELVAQEDDGVQLSGRYCTSSSNSRMRVIASLVARQMAGYHLPDHIDVAAMGDDCVERYYSGVDACLDKLGHTVKMTEVTDVVSGISFCSHKWNESGLAEPETVGKTVFRFLSHPVGSVGYPGWYVQLAWVVRNHPRSQEILSACYPRVNM